MTSFTKAETTAFAVGAAVMVLYVLGQMNRPILSIIGGVILTGLSFSACMLAVMCIRKTWVSFRDRQSQLWLCVALGISAFFLAYVSGDIYLFSGFEVTLVSVLDVFFVSGYTLIIIGLLVQLWPFKELISRNIVFGGTLFGFLLILAFWWLTMPSHSSPVDVELVIAFLYPVLDITLLVASVAVVRIFRTGTFWRPLLFLVGGIILGLLGDMSSAFFVQATGQTYYPDNPLLLFFDWANISAALGFYLRYKQVTTRAI